MKRNEQGFIIVMIAVVLLIILSLMGGLVIDAGRAYVAKGELENAADAAALAGAGALYKDPPLAPDWTAASSAATRFVQNSTVAGTALKECQVTPGFWNIATETFTAGNTVTPTGKCDATGIPCTASAANCSCLQTDAPAILVSIEKSNMGQNGSIPTFFARMAGWTDFQPAAKGLAISAAPRDVPSGTLFPFAIAYSVKNCFITNQRPNKDDIIQLNGKSTLCPGYTGQVGDWTNLSTGNASSADKIKDYINQFNGGSDKSPAVLKGQKIQDVNGSKDTLYSTTKSLIDAGKGLVLMPVVQDGQQPSDPVVPNVVRGYIGVQLTDASTTSCNSGNTGAPITLPCIEGRFVGYFPLHPGAIKYGGEPTSAIPPKLVKAPASQ